VELTAASPVSGANASDRAVTLVSTPWQRIQQAAPAVTGAQRAIDFFWAGPIHASNGRLREYREFLRTLEDLPTAELERLFTEIRFDAKGNPIWEMRATLPRRRADDDTVDLLKCLDIGSLSLADAKDEPESTHETDGYNPYHRDQRR
jgi:hypothetical protein